jgi:hypothetical protein
LRRRQMRGDWRGISHLLLFAGRERFKHHDDEDEGEKRDCSSPLIHAK